MQNEGLFESPIFVTGIPRSGLSMVAGVVGLCGAWIGHTIPGAEINPLGFFEHRQIRDKIVKKLLEGINADPFGVKDLPELTDVQPFRRFKFAIREVVEGDGYQFDRRWMFKECKLTLTWPAFVEAFPDATWLVVTHDRSRVIDSCMNTSYMRRNSEDPQFWEQFVDAYQARLDELKIAAKQVFELDAGKICRGDLGKLFDVIRHLGLELDQNEVALFVKPGLWNIG